MNDGRKKKPQKHQNKTAFKIQFNPLAQEIHKKVSFKGLCKRCADQLQWKIQYNKYKKMTEPAKCTICNQKNVFRSYMRACDSCWQGKNFCPKCLQVQNEQNIQTRLNQMEQKKQDQETERKMNDFLKTLKERSRRTVKRQFEKGTIEWSNELNTFVDGEGNTLPLQFKQGFGGHDKEEGDEDFSDDGDIADQEGNMSDIDSDQEELEKQQKIQKKGQYPQPSKKKEDDLDEEDDEDIDVEVQAHQVEKVEADQVKENVEIQIVTVTGKKEKEHEEKQEEHPDLEAKYGEDDGEWQDIQEDTEDLQKRGQKGVGEGETKKVKH